MPLAEIPLCVWRKRSRTFVFRGQSIRYWTAGQGEPLLLIHGFPTASWDWHYLWQPLAQRYRVIACDMLGFGDSAKPLNHSYSLLEQADLQQALLAHLQVEQPLHILAHDYGDSVAQELLARHYENRIEVGSCVFLNGGLFPETHRPVLMQKLLLSPLGWMIGRAFTRDGLVKSFRQIFGPQTGPTESELDDFWSLIETHRGPRIMHKLIGYIPERRVQRDRWVAAMQTPSCYRASVTTHRSRRRCRCSSIIWRFVSAWSCRHAKSPAPDGAGGSSRHAAIIPQPYRPPFSPSRVRCDPSRRA